MTAFSRPAPDYFQAMADIARSQLRNILLLSLAWCCVVACLFLLVRNPQTLTEEICVLLLKWCTCTKFSLDGLCR